MKLEETLSNIDAGNMTYVKELCALNNERKALRNIVLGARHRVRNMEELAKESSGHFTEGALMQAKHDLEVIEFVINSYEVEIEEAEHDKDSEG